jgi:endonuclease/exonuclease/phosphatase (EEP) superfamily protein YafD
MERAVAVTKKLAWVLTYGLLAGITLVGLAVTLAEFGARHWWPLELVSNFRVPLALVLAVCAILLFLLDQHLWAGLAVLLAAVNLGLVMLLFLPGEEVVVRRGRPVEILLANVLRSNPDHQAVVTLIQREEPDVAVLLEVDEGWMKDLAPLAAAYPHSIAEPRDTPYGLAILSRLPLAETVTTTIGSLNAVAVATTLDVGGPRLHLVAGHAPMPSDASGTAARNQGLADLGRFAAGRRGALVLCGDLNVTPWSPFFRDLLQTTGLRDSRQGFGIQPTWTTRLPRLLAIPIDHCLASSDLAVQGVRFGPQIGSDHLPLLVEVAIATR